MAEQCGYFKAWIGPCKNEAGESGRCPDHENERCVVCQEPAALECGTTMQFVCGAPLCPDHHHAPYPGYGHE